MSLTHIEALEPAEVYELIAPLAHEVKAIAFSAMDARTDFSDTEMLDEVRRLQGKNPAWMLSSGLMNRYCESFEPAGIVEETTGKNRTRTFGTTTYGEAVGKPLAGHMLDLSLNEEQSLASIFGPMYTNSPEGIRPCERRIRILDLLHRSEGKKIRVSEISRSIGVRIGHAGGIIDTMASTGLVTESATGKGRSYVSYLADPSFADIHVRRNGASQLYLDSVQAITDYFAQFPEIPFTNTQIATELIQSGKSDMPLGELTDRVASTTYRLANIRGVLVSTRETDIANSKAIVWANEDQLKVISAVLDVVDGIRQPTEEYISEGKQKTKAIFKDPDIVKYLIAKAKKDSIALKAFEKEQTRIQNDIERILARTTASLSVREVREQMLELGHNISNITVRRHINILAKSGNFPITDTSAGAKYLKAA